MGGAERVARQHAAGKLTVRERVERLLDAGSFHETGALAGKGDYDERGRADRLPAGQRRRRAGPDRRPPRGGPGRRLHRPRRGGRRRHLGEDGVGRARRPRAARPARAPGRRHGRRGQRQDARDDGLLLRAAAAGLRPRGREPLARARSSPPRSGRARGSAPRASSSATSASSCAAARSSSSPARRSWPRRWASRPTRRSSAARARRRAPARSTTRPPTRTTRSISCGASSPTCRAARGRRRRSPRAATRSTRREEELLAIVPRERRQTYRMRRVLELVLDAGSLFEVGARYGRSVVTAWRASTGARWASWPPTPTTTPAG